MPSAAIHSRARALELVEDRATSSSRRLARRAGSACGRTRCGSRRRGRRARTAGPGDGGTITGKEPMSSATALACSGPAPPKATSAKSRGSWPRWTETSRSAPAMFSLAIARMPSAAASSERPIASAIGLHGRARAPRRRAPSRRRSAAAAGGRRRRSRRSPSAPRRPRRRPPGPGSAPADCGPTRSAFVSSGTWAIEPPPAPTVWTSTHGTLIRNWPMVVSRPIVGSPSRHSDDVGRRAAHVEREDVRVAGAGGDVQRARDAAGRAARARRRPGCARPRAASSRPRRSAGC